jgi:hypothetical protein
MDVATSAAERTIHLSAYVERGIDELIDTFAGDEVNELLGEVSVAALGSSGGAVAVRASSPQPVSNGTARIAVEWEAVGAGGTRVAGSGCISLLVVQSGREPVTELRVSRPGPEETSSAVAPVVRHFRDDLAERLSRPAP